MDNVDTAKIITSTVMKPRLTSTAIKTFSDQSNAVKVGVEASPVLGREKVDTPSTKTVHDASFSTPATRLIKPVMSTLAFPQSTLVHMSRTHGNKSGFTLPVNSFEQQHMCEEVYNP